LPVTLPNGSTYRLCLLDTNALSEIVKHPTVEGRGYIERFPPAVYVPCFTVYNLIELRRNADVFQEFTKFFSVYPSFITQPFQIILDAEVRAGGHASVNSILFRAFTAFGPDASFNLKSFITDLFTAPQIAQLESGWRTCNQDVLNTWLTNKANFSPDDSVPNAKDADRFVNDATVDTLCQLYPAVVQASITNNNIPQSLRFPSMQIMLYSQYYRVFDPTWTANDQEVTDVCITACAPYVDAIVTEKFQAEIYKKVQKMVDGLTGVLFARLRDIRHST
jgi:hypothetical protein